ncbi:tRNA 2'-phosphotransferase [Parahypoxylon ruwenzoriense]
MVHKVHLPPKILALPNLRLPRLNLPLVGRIGSGTRGRCLRSPSRQFTLRSSGGGSGGGGGGGGSGSGSSSLRYCYGEQGIGSGRFRTMDEDEYAETAERMVSLALRGKGGESVSHGGGNGGGERGGITQKREMLISRALSALLRHQAGKAGIKLDAEGYAPLDEVREKMQWGRLHSLNPSVGEILQTVSVNEKQRFAVKPNPAALGARSTEPVAWLIRANQGHSIPLADEALHTPITLEARNIPDVVVHGTYFAFWPAIMASGGLRRMARQHVHFGTGLLPEGGGGGDGDKRADGEEGKEGEEGAPGPGPERKVISGMRSDAELLVFADVERCLREDPGTKWWLSANGVVLTEGNKDGIFPLRYVKEVRGRTQGVDVLWRDGKKVADLPPDVVAKTCCGWGV